MPPVADLTLTLRNGVKMPLIGLGCWNGRTREEALTGKDWFISALKSGYKHLDTGHLYLTEEVVPKAIKEAGIDRKDVFITTKVSWFQAYDVQAGFNNSLKELDTDYVDLYLIHWPQVVERVDATDTRADPDNIAKTPGGDNKVVDRPNFNDVWAEMEKIYESGKAKAIGVSNFSVKTLNELLATAKVVPHVNQVEMHPYLAQPELMKFCKEKGIQLTAYTPTGYATVRNDPTIGEIAKKNGVSPTQIILAWHLRRGVTLCCRSTSAERQRENINLPTLSDEDFETINKLNRDQRVCNFPNERGLVWGWTLERLGW
ncbi:hypothetical protein EIP91_007621 [Steccherinum ochraceum]|uniref:NADP-dependent oxidoreductase domain-containing protein n=1 Tax=Steccherinum ochraceum TaxID=92696 RepID=A0A4R0R6P9_9APHY|nr:hypothetical protein EIP91_007621 [Steccherinum ochraceum]